MTNIATLIKKVFAILLTIALVTSTNALYTSTVLAAPGINYQIGYQGFLKDSSGNIVIDGNYDMVFNIYNVSSGGTPLWTGTHTGANSNPIVVDDGFFHVLLGSGTGNAMTVDFNQDEYYIGITVGPDSEMSPRHRIAAHPQAFNADLLDGLDSTAFVQSLGSPIGSSANGGSISSGFLTLSLADDTNPGLVSTGAQTFAGDKTFNGALTFNNSTVLIPNNLNFDSNTLFIDANNNRIGVGTVAPAYLMDLAGASSIAQRTIGMNGTALLYLPDQGINAGQFAGSLALGGGLRSLSNPASGVPGRFNTALGIDALRDNTTGYANTASGYTTLLLNTEGYSNSAHGDAALYYNTTGNANTADGNAALFFNTTGSSNTASGFTSLYYNTTGSHNLALGSSALYENIDGDYNIALGTNAGSSHSSEDNETGDYNIFIGPYTRALAANDQNEIVIGNNATGIGSDTVTLGNDNVITTSLKGNIGIGTTTPTNKLHLEGALTLASSTPATTINALYNQAGILYWNGNSLDMANSILQNGNSFGGLVTIGTNDNNALAFETNNTERLRILTNGNVGIGTTTPSYLLDLAGASSIAQRTIGMNGTALLYLPDQGINAGQFAGSLALGGGLRNLSNSSGDSSGRYNSALGINTLRDNTTGFANTASGYGSLFFNTTGYSNSAHGTSALGVNTTGNANTADGNSALVNNTSGSNNTASGYISLNYNTTGSYNVALGSNALYQNTDGSHNIALGFESGMLYGGGVNNTTGDYNIFIGPGTRALSANDQNEIVIGNDARGIGSNTVTLGNNSVVTTALKGNVGIGTTNPSSKLHVAGVTTVGGDILPNADDAYDLGSPSMRFRDLYLGPASLHIGDDTLSNNSGSLVWSGSTIETVPSATSSTELRLSELSANGSNYVGIKAPNSITSNVLWTLPSADGTNGQVLSTNGSGALSWATAGGSSQWTTSGSDIYYNIGNVGIGTTAPNNKLQVANLIEFDDTNFVTKLGYQAGKNIFPGAQKNTFVGYQAGLASPTGSTLLARYNTSIGYQSLYSNTTGSNNSIVGSSALFYNTNGDYNSAVGSYALFNNTEGDQNTAMGSYALVTNTTGANNTAVGRESLGRNTTGANNSALGLYSLYVNTTGSQNTAMGVTSGQLTSIGTSNETSSNSLYLGYATRALASGDTNEIVIGALAIGLGSNTVVLGNSSIVTTALRGNVGIGESSPTAKLHLGPTTTAAAQIRLNSTAANPTTPNIGDLWFNGTNLNFRKNSTTTTDLLASGGGGGAFTYDVATTPDKVYFYDGLTTESADFIFGSNQLDNQTGALDDYRMFFDKSTGAFRAGYATGIQWNAANVGFASIAMGDHVMASGNTSVAIGSSTVASGLYSTAMNVNTAASGYYSTAMNYQTTASGEASTSMGRDTTAQAYASVALGRYNVLTGSSGSWVDTDPVFVIGNGINASNRSNALTVLKNGSMGIGTTAPSAKLEVKATGVTTGTIAKFTSDNTTGCSIATGGTIACSSDASLKKNDQEITGALDDTLLLRPVTFDWNYEEDGAGNNIGFIAQEVEEVLPGLVTTDENGLKFLKYDRFAPILVKAIQELNEKVDALGGSPIASSSSLLRMNEERFAKLEEQGVITSVENLVVHGEGIFERFASFLGDAFFGGRVTFADHDMAGFATIKNGADRVHITFDREYEYKPVVQVTMDSTVKLDDTEFQVKTMAGECEKDTGKEACEEFLGKKLTGDMLVNHSVANVTEEGFDIILDTRAFQDLNFNWIVIQVKDAKRHESEKVEIHLPKLELGLEENNEN